MHDLVTGRSVAATLHLVNKTPSDWYSKKQATMETATYGSEFVVSQTCVKQIIDLRNTLRYLGVPICRKDTCLETASQWLIALCKLTLSSTSVIPCYHSIGSERQLHQELLETLILMISSVNIGVMHRYGLNSRHFYFGRVILEVSQSEYFKQMGSVKISFVCSSILKNQAYVYS
jgi:hypothetical protein